MVVQEAVERRTITQLPDLVNSLSGDDREAFTSILTVSVQVAELHSNTLSLDGLHSQPAFKILNRPERVLGKINGVRALRPQDSVDTSKLDAEIEERRGKDPFCLEQFETETPYHAFGRIRGVSSATGANLYSASRFHTMLFFSEHDPRIPPTRVQFLDRLDVADHFYEAAHRADERAIYSSFGQNNLERAGASIWYHGHAQLQQEIGSHEGVMEGLLDVFHNYRWKTGRDYFQNLFRAHQVVGLGVEQNGVMVMPFLTPTRDRHIRMVAYSFDESQRDVLFRILRYFMDEEGFDAKAFNFSIGYRPLSYDGRDWGGFPAIIAEIIDRGDISKRNSDMGFSETLLKSYITSTDPYAVQEGIEQALAA